MLNTIRFDVNNTEEHYAATTPEQAAEIRNVIEGGTCGWTFRALNDTLWSIHAGDAETGFQYLGQAHLTTSPARMVAYEGRYWTVEDAMWLAGY